MKLKSNIGQVINRMRRLQEGLPEAVAQALAPASWKPSLEHVAFTTLRAQWALERDLQTRAVYEAMTPRLVHSIVAEVFGTVGTGAWGTRFSMNADMVQASGELNLERAAEYNLGSRTPTGRRKRYATIEADEEENLTAVRQAIQDWVMLEKDWSEEELKETEEQVAKRIQEILGVSERATPRARTAAMEEAAARIRRRIAEWLDGEGQTPPTLRTQRMGERVLHPTQRMISGWLETVLVAWRSYVLLNLKRKVSLQIAKLNMRVKTELI